MAWHATVLTCRFSCVSCAEAIPPEYVLRPAFRRGAEVVVYSDAAHLHSAPDYISREAVWRFM